MRHNDDIYMYVAITPFSSI